MLYSLPLNQHIILWLPYMNDVIEFATPTILACMA